MRNIISNSLRIMLLLLLTSHAFAFSQVTSYDLNTVNDNQAVLTLDFNKNVKQKPTSFKMTTPSRLVLDFAHSGSQLKQEQQSFNSNLISRVQFVSAGQRLRVVINLRQAVSHHLDIKGKKVMIRLRTTAAKAGIATATLTKFDFKNGETNHGGKILLTLSRNGVDTRIKNKENQFSILLRHTRLAAKLAHKYEVSDFKTPAKAINLYQQGDDTRLVVHTKGDYELASYQINKQYVIDIIPAQDLKTNYSDDKYHGKRISLNFQNIPVRQVLQVIAEFTDENVIINDSVSGNISLRLQDVPWDQALKIILQTQGLVDRRVGNVLMIAPAGELAQQDLRQMQAREELSNLGPLEDETFHIRYGKAEAYYETLTNPDHTLLSARGKIIVNKRTNKLFVKDTSSKIKAIKAYIQETDVPVKQVEIEARIVTVNNSFERQLGINWNVQGNNTPNPGGGTGTEGQKRFSLDLAANGIGGTNPATLAYSTLASDVLIGLELSALEAEGGGEILSSPRLLTADQQEAVIEQGTEIPYNESTSSGAAAVAFKQAVLRLRVTPQITPNNKVLLKLQVNQDAQGNVAPGTNVPTIDTRQITTNVLVDNGETVVLGGIYERTKSKSVTRVPFLSDIPLLGELFKHRSMKDERKELLIFVTPRIVHNDALTQ